MPSIPPPLPQPSSCSTPWEVSAPEKKIGAANRVNWFAILASVSLSFALVVGVIAWIVAHPHQSPLSRASMREDAIEPPPQTFVVSATPAFHRPQPRDGIAKHIRLIEEAPPLLPPPTSPQPRRMRGEDEDRLPWQAPPNAQVKQPQSPAGQTYGTQVLFHNNRAGAADLARQERKLLFIMHISGNFEDSCFT